MPSSPRDEIQMILHSFREVNRAIYSLLREEADVLNLTPVQMMVIHALAKMPNIGLGELAKQLQLGMSTTSGVVERLVGAGLIVRERSTADRRLLTMRLTKEGEKKNNEAFQDDSILMKRLMRIAEINPSDLNHLYETHKKILEKLQLEGEETTP
ncbi:MarR family winged helix-turn-helix transcriptional regulator [Camelliibacillus cellulosilyticus]|uniref:MarR family winged helix-turn-helix transcriptional regulator n=1 Tax=Camelliibacillus cellulosilyticus TaxID=2174486 RepID=A0ABV9GKE6_9BACL